MEDDEQHSAYDRPDTPEFDDDDRYAEPEDGEAPSGLAGRTAELTLENGNLRRDVEVLQKQVERVKADLRHKTAELSSATVELAAERERADTLAEELASAKAIAAEESGALRDELESIRAVMEEDKAVELQKLRSELDFAKAQGDNKHWKDEKSELLDRVDELEAKLRTAKKEAAAAATVPEAVPPGLSIDPAEVEKMLTESATEIRHLQGQVEHWKREAAKAAEAAQTASAAAEEASTAARKASAPAVVAEADAGAAAEAQLLREQLAAAAAATQELDARGEEQRKLHGAEVARLNKQMLALRAKVAVGGSDTDQPPQLTPSKPGAKKAGVGAGSAADPLLREQEKLKKQLSDKKCEMKAKADENKKLEAEIVSLKEEHVKARKARVAEKKRWQTDQDALRQQVESAQSADGDMLAQVEAIASQTHALSAEVSLWQERAAS